jgi:hypothetical protein
VLPGKGNVYLASCHIYLLSIAEFRDALPVCIVKFRTLFAIYADLGHITLIYINDAVGS